MREWTQERLICEGHSILYSILDPIRAGKGLRPSFRIRDRGVGGCRHTAVKAQASWQAGRDGAPCGQGCLRAASFRSSVLESAAATGSADELFEHVPVDLPERSRLGHLRQVVHAELEAELLQVLQTITQ